MEDSLLLTILQEQTKLGTRTEQQLEEMHKRLFGNGQPGILDRINTKIDDVAKEAASVKDSTSKEAAIIKEHLENRINQIDTSRKLDRMWLAGACAVLILEGTLVAFYFKYLSGLLHNLVK